MPTCRPSVASEWRKAELRVEHCLGEADLRLLLRALAGLRVEFKGRLNSISNSNSGYAIQALGHGLAAEGQVLHSKT